MSKQSKEKEYALAEWKQILDFALIKKDKEEKRENSLLQQASQMQTAFSVVIAAILMVVPIILQYIKKVPSIYIFILVSVVVSFLLLSLLFASIAQWRWQIDFVPDVSTIKDIVLKDEKWEEYLDESWCVQQKVELLEKMDTSQTRVNDKRVHLIMISQICFYVSLALIIVGFISMVCVFR